MVMVTMTTTITVMTRRHFSLCVPNDLISCYFDAKTFSINWLTRYININTFKQRGRIMVKAEFRCFLRLCVPK